MVAVYGLFCMFSRADDLLSRYGCEKTLKRPLVSTSMIYGGIDNIIKSITYSPISRYVQRGRRWLVGDGSDDGDDHFEYYL